MSNALSPNLNNLDQKFTTQGRNNKFGLSNSLLYTSTTGLNKKEKEENAQLYSSTNQEPGNLKANSSMSIGNKYQLVANTGSWFYTI